jgi:hypothetical protein
MGPPLERFARDGDVRGLRRRDHALADVAAADRPVLVAVAPLERLHAGRNRRQAPTIAGTVVVT